MMRIISKSNLKDIILLWAIFNLKACVDGHPMFAGNAARFAEDAKSLGATASGDDALRLSSSFSHQSSAGTKIDTSAAVKRPTNDFEDVEIAGAMGKGHVNSLEALRELPKKDPPGSDGKSLVSQVDDSKVTAPVPNSLKSSEESMTLNKRPIQDIPDKAPQVDGSDNPSTQNSVAADGQGLKIPGQDSKETSAAHSTSKASQADLKDTRTPSVKNTEEDLLKSTTKAEIPTPLVASDVNRPPTPEALKGLTNKQYVEKAAESSDKNVLKNYKKWISAQEHLRETRSGWFSNAKQSFDARNPGPKSEALFNNEMRALIRNSDGNELAAQDQFIAKQANVNIELSGAANAINKAEISAAKAESAALKSADEYFKRSGILKSSALRYKHTGWSITKFFKKIWAWIFRRGRKGPQNKETATTVKTSTGDRPIETTASEAVPKEDVAKVVEPSDKNLVNLGEHTPEGSKRPAIDTTSAKSANTAGDADLKENPSRFRYWPSSWTNRAPSDKTSSPSQGYWQSWLPWSGKKVQPVENDAQSVQNTASPNGWFSRFRRNGPSSEKSLDSDTDYLSPFSRSADTVEEVQPVHTKNMKLPASTGAPSSVVEPAETQSSGGIIPGSLLHSA